MRQTIEAQHAATDGHSSRRQMILDLNNPNDTNIFRKGTEGKIVGITSGCFDLTHYLHLVYFLRCRRLCDYLVVGVDSDDLTRKTKGPDRPYVSEDRHAAMVDAMKPVHAAFIMGSVADLRRGVERLGARKIFKNEDFAIEDIVGGDLAEIVSVPDIVTVDSTTAMIEEILRRKSDGAGKEEGA